MKIEIVGLPEFRFQLTEAQIALLWDRSRAHYDAVCRRASSIDDRIPFDERFIVTWSRCMSYDGHVELDYVHRASWRQLDITLKILEYSRPGAPNDEELLRVTLRDSFWRAMDLARDSMKNWKATSK